MRALVLTVVQASRLAVFCALLAMVVAIPVGPAAAGLGPCVGDCDGNGRVTVSELIRAVRVALGNASVTECASVDLNSDGRASVAELIQAVVDSLYGCNVVPPTSTPTPTSTQTFTPSRTFTNSPTPTRTPSPTTTHTPERVPLRWMDSDGRLTSSTCRSDLTENLRDEVENTPPCTIDIMLTGGDSIRMVDCQGLVREGSIDGANVARATFRDSDSVQGCRITIDENLEVDLDVSPTTLVTIGDVDFDGDCQGLRDCMVTVEYTWTRVDLRR